MRVGKAFQDLGSAERNRVQGGDRPDVLNSGIARKVSRQPRCRRASRTRPRWWCRAADRESPERFRRSCPAPRRRFHAAPAPSRRSRAATGRAADRCADALACAARSTSGMPATARTAQRMAHHPVRPAAPVAAGVGPARESQRAQRRSTGRSRRAAPATACSRPERRPWSRSSPPMPMDLTSLTRTMSIAAKPIATAEPDTSTVRPPCCAGLQSRRPTATAPPPGRPGSG